MDTTTITIGLKVKKILDGFKRANRESYNEVLERVLQNAHAIMLDRESLEATIEILSDPETMKRLAESMQDLKEGRVYDFEEF